MGNDIQYLVHIEDDRAFLTVIGKAGYLNCMHAGEFFKTVAEKGCKHLVIDLKQCTGMDSTFLGAITGVALKLRKNGGEVSLLNLNERNAQVVENLGIDRIVKIGTSECGHGEDTEIANGGVSSESILAAHENLVEADSENLKKFKDVISFLRKETGK